MRSVSVPGRGQGKGGAVRKRRQGSVSNGPEDGVHSTLPWAKRLRSVLVSHRGSSVRSSRWEVRWSWSKAKELVAVLSTPIW